ncbi:MAG: tRNA lysidine(34) synthetase TilS, partial [Porphyromonadaceae bacterium]|nr:tRNA lysidine(34) synthetase TilS [Porphyromonadaceae bacterium]
MLLSNGIDPSCDRLLVGLSGGADSVALALLLKELGFDMVAAHCNFHLRGEESVRDECFVRNFCQRYKIALECISFDTYEYAEMHALSIEMAARDLRYTWFEQLRTNHRLSYIAVAHHLDDNVETVLLNLIRGTGLNGLCAMPLVRENFVLRPLINVTKQQILDYLKLKGQSFCTDSTNVDTQFKRNKVRHELIPLLKEFNPSVIDGISRMIENLQGVRVWLDTHLMPDK